MQTVHEQVMVPVTLTRQQVSVEYMDVDPATAVPVSTDKLLDGATSNWLVLTADEPVVTTRPVPVERVRLATSWVSATTTVQAQLAHEEVVVDGADSPREPRHA